MKQLTSLVILLIGLAPAVLAQEKDVPPTQASLVSTERAFARLAVERGINESFITYFADEGIGFAPHPYKVKEVLNRRPAPTARPALVLNWAPIYGDISRAGDLGYNTGPTVFEDHGPEKRPTDHGMFFSVWKKQSDGSWRVVLDMGASTPSAVAAIDAPFRAAPRSGTKPVAGRVNIEEQSAGLLSLDRKLIATAKAGSVGQAYQSYLSDDARVHRTGVMPTVGRDALRAWVTRQTMTLTAGEPIKAEVASSGDLGYVYGSYELGGAKPEKGYYARVWKRDNAGEWKIVVDTHSLIPEQDRETTLNLEGYQLLQQKKTKEAIELFKRVVAEFPLSANANDSLSDAYEADGNKELAIEFAQKALDLLPNDPNPNQDLKNRMKDSATEKLKRLKTQ